MTYIVTRVLHGCSTGGDSYSHPPNISSFDILGNPHSTQSLPGYEGLRQPKKLPPLQRGAGGNHEFDDFNIPFMAHYTQSRSENRGFAATTFGAQGGVA